MGPKGWGGENYITLGVGFPTRKHEIRAHSSRIAREGFGMQLGDLVVKSLLVGSLCDLGRLRPIVIPGVEVKVIDRHFSLSPSFWLFSLPPALS